MDLPNAGQTRPCCIKREFRKVISVNTMDGDTGPRVATHTRCAVCGNNHYLLEVPPIPIGLTGSPI